MIRNQILLMVFMCCSLLGFSQITLKGTVTDSLNAPISFANIIAKPQDSIKKIKFSVTDALGNYKLLLDKTSYMVSASYMGYGSYQFEVALTEDTIKDIILKEQANMLDEVKIQLPVTVKKDTIVYKVERFLTGDERKLKNVLEKLPGVEVDRDGTVTFQGKKITTVLVENKKFFGGNSKLAVDNLPANAIDQIEIIDNYSEIAILKDLIDSNEMALNVKLKEDKKNFVFGDVEAGKGNQDFYRTHANLFYYAPKTTVNFIGNLNNIADEVFTYRQFFDFQGGSSEIFKKGSINLNSSLDDFLEFLESSDVVKSDRKFGAININQDVNEKLNISGYGIFSDTNENKLSVSNNQYNNFLEVKDVASSSKNGLGIGNVKIAYLPNLTEQWYFKTQFKKSKNSADDLINSNTELTDSFFEETFDATSNFFDQTIEWYKNSSRAHTFSSMVNYKYDDSQFRNYWETPSSIFQELIPVIDQNLYRVEQFKSKKSISLDAVFNHYWVLNKNNHIYSTFGNTYLNQKFSTQNLQRLDDVSINVFDDLDFQNNLKFALNDMYLGTNYKVKKGIFTFNQGVFLHYYFWNANQEPTITKNKVVVLPSFSTKIDFDQTKKLQLDYNLKSSFLDVSKYANKFYLQSYNALYRGNEELENELFHNVNLTYRNFKAYKGLNMYFQGNYVKKVKGVINVINYQGVNQILTTRIIDDPQAQWRINGNLKKKTGRISYRLEGLYSHSRYLQQVNGITSNVKSKELSYKVAGKTLFNDFPIIEIGYKQSYGNYNLSESTSKFTKSEIYANLDYDFWKGYILSVDFVSNKFRNNSLNQSNKFNLANASLYYRKDNSAWSFTFNIKNLFDVQNKSSYSFSEYIISDTQIFILPRIFMFSIGYNL